MRARHLLFCACCHCLRLPGSSLAAPSPCCPLLGPFHSSAFPCSFCCKRNFCFELSCLEKCLRPAMPPPRGIERQGPFEGFFQKATSTGPHEPIPVLFTTVFVSVWILLLVSATSGASVEERPVYVSRAGKAFSRCR